MKANRDDFESPVPAWDHYRIVKKVEEAIHAELESLDYKGYAIGLYAGYALAPDEKAQSEDDAYPFAMSFGYQVGRELNFLTPDEEYFASSVDERDSGPLTDEFIEKMYRRLEAELNQAVPPETGTILPRLEITVAGSTYCYGLMCKLCRPGQCTRRTCVGKKRWFKRTCSGWVCQHTAC